jgi:hypothetical protein
VVRFADFVIVDIICLLTPFAITHCSARKLSPRKERRKQLKARVCVCVCAQLSLHGLAVHVREDVGEAVEFTGGEGVCVCVLELLPGEAFSAGERAAVGFDLCEVFTLPLGGLLCVCVCVCVCECVSERERK